MSRPIREHHAGTTRIGKRNLLNNFCIASRGNEKSCTKCHIGYGWKDDGFDYVNGDTPDDCAPPPRGAGQVFKPAMRYSGSSLVETLHLST